VKCLAPTHNVILRLPLFPSSCAERSGVAGPIHFFVILPEGQNPENESSADFHFVILRAAKRSRRTHTQAKPTTSTSPWILRFAQHDKEGVFVILAEGQNPEVRNAPRPMCVASKTRSHVVTLAPFTRNSVSDGCLGFSRHEFPDNTSDSV